MLGAVAEELGMPLHSEHVVRAVDLDALDMAVLVVGDRAHALSEFAEHLMVEGVDAERFGPDDAPSRESGSIFTVCASTLYWSRRM